MEGRESQKSPTVVDFALWDGGAQGGGAQARLGGVRRPPPGLILEFCPRPWGADHLHGEGVGFRVITLRDQYWFRGEPYRGCYGPHGCGEAGRHLGSLCAIEVVELKRRPPTVGGPPMP